MDSEERPKENVTTDQKAVAEQPASSDQPAIMSALKNPKKKRKGLIIGIVSGSVALIALIVGLILYFVVFNSPQHKLDQAVANAIMAENYVVNGTLTGGGAGSGLTLKLSQAEGGGEAQIVLNSDASTGAPGAKKLSVKVDVRMMKDALYVKPENINEVVSMLAGMFLLRAQLTPGGEVDNSGAIMMQQLKALVDEVEGQWIRIPYDTLEQSPEMQCMMKLSQGDKDHMQARREIADLYRKHSFLKVKESLGATGNLQGFEIDTAANTTEARRQFAEALKESTYFKKLKECGSTSPDGFVKSLTEESKGNNKTALKVWIDGSNHIRRVEATDPDGKNAPSLKLEVMYGEAKKVDTPAESKNIQDIIQKFQDSPLSELIPQGAPKPAAA